MKKNISWFAMPICLFFCFLYLCVAWYNGTAILFSKIVTIFLIIVYFLCFILRLISWCLDKIIISDVLKKYEIIHKYFSLTYAEYFGNNREKKLEIATRIHNYCDQLLYRCTSQIRIKSFSKKHVAILNEIIAKAEEIKAKAYIPS